MTSTEHYMAHMGAAEIGDYARRLAAANRAVGRAKAEVAWYAAACLRDGAVPSEGDLQYLRQKCTELDRLQGVAETINDEVTS